MSSCSHQLQALELYHVATLCIQLAWRSLFISHENNTCFTILFLFSLLLNKDWRIVIELNLTHSYVWLGLLSESLQLSSLQQIFRKYDSKRVHRLITFNAWFISFDSVLSFWMLSLLLLSILTVDYHVGGISSVLNSGWWRWDRGIFQLWSKSSNEDFMD